jgi:cobalt-zinc-cadmium efflux system outer membrane protein
MRARAAWRGFGWVALASAAAGCAGDAAVARWEAPLAQARVEARAGERAAPAEAAPDGSLGAYVAAAMRESPALEARYEEWRGAVAATGSADQLPEPMLAYSWLIQHIETRVGPQRHRLGLRQAVPWPGKLWASVEVADARAEGARRRFEAEAVALRWRVWEAWWPWWALGERRALLREQRALLEQVAAILRGRLETGRASLAELSQVELSLAMLEDRLQSLEAQEVAAAAKLRAVIGASPGASLPSPSGEPALVGSLPPLEEVLALAGSHPRVLEQRAVAQEGRARGERAEADRYPNVELGFEWMETGAAPHNPNDPESGKDPLMAMIAVGLPIWQGSYDARAEEAQASERAAGRRGLSVQRELEGEIMSAYAMLRDSGRRVRLYEGTLLPQAQTVWLSSLGDYETGQVGAAVILLGWRDLLELHLGLLGARVDHMMAWARLEAAAGREVLSEEAP